MLRIDVDNTYRLLKKALDASTLRQQAISNNIANINTPNYQADRVIFEQELKKAMSDFDVQLKATHKYHIGLRNGADGVEPRLVKDRSPAMRNDGNNVDIDVEMANLAANQLLYNTLIQQINQKIGILRHVITEGRG
ncbi:MAG TPA: flagellar basal body rod protein FlgB [Clostridiales bacterium]|nr:flagellar basal body rod protein FlgB [Clostridiales bacterium]